MNIFEGNGSTQQIAAERSRAGDRPGVRTHARGVELLEFALILPILLLLIIGVWDFGSALLLRDRMTNAAREGARVAVSIPLNEANCAGPVPCAIVTAAGAVQKYMNSAGNDLSCITPDQPSAFDPAVPAMAVYTCPNGTSLQINRGVMVNSSNGQIPSTQVILTCPLRWVMLGRFLPGPFSQTTTTTVTMQNLT